MEEREVKLASGTTGLVGMFLGAVVIALLFVAGASSEMKILTGLGVLGGIVWFAAWFGFVVNSPNQTKVVQLFGKYVGTLRETGFFYGNPFYYRTPVSLRVRTFETGVSKGDDVKNPTTGQVISKGTQTRHPSKVNDRDGTPIDIAAVVVWQVTKPADAVFKVDEYEEFVKIQSEAALRNLASQYPYDGTNEERTLRGSTAQIGEQLKVELQERFVSAGVEVLEARISYLAYSAEIASAMLQRQQAGALIAARIQIVDAAVSMVQHALDELSKRQVVDLDADRRAAMVSNLMVVLCSHSGTQPVINAGTLHN